MAPIWAPPLPPARLAALTLAAAAAGGEAADVLCGGHFASDCSACPGDNGEVWCHGDCMWLSGPFGVGGGSCVLAGVTGVSEGPMSYGYSFLVSATIMLIFACVYNQKVIKGPPELPKINGVISPVRRGLFDCIFHPDTCLYTTFCLPVVVAKNYYAAEVCPFWPGCILTFLGTYSPFYLVTVCVRAVLSGKVQEKMGMEHNICMDLLHSAFCFPCAVGRESLEIDAEIGADIKCCCKVSITPRFVAEVEHIVEQAQEKTSRGCDGVRKYRMCGGEGH